MRNLFLALIVSFAALGAASCSTLFSPLQDPAGIGCTKEETNECRVLIAARIVDSLNVTIGEQLDAGIISAAEARRLRSLTKAAEDAVKAARAVLPLENATTVERIATLNALLVQLLREQIAKQGV